MHPLFFRSKSALTLTLIASAALLPACGHKREADAPAAQAAVEAYNAKVAVSSASEVSVSTDSGISSSTETQASVSSVTATSVGTASDASVYTATHTESSVAISTRSETNSNVVEFPDGSSSERLDKSAFQRRTMNNGQYVMDVILGMPDSLPHQSTIYFAACMSKAADGVMSGLSGITLLPGSFAAVKRDTSYQFADGSSANGLAPMSAYYCAAEEDDANWLDHVTPQLLSLLDVSHLKLDESTSDIMLASPNGVKEEQKQSVGVVVRCRSHLSGAERIGSNGITLTPGSQMLIRRDLEKVGENQPPFKLFTCN